MSTSHTPVCVYRHTSSPANPHLYTQSSHIPQFSGLHQLVALRWLCVIGSHLKTDVCTVGTENMFPFWSELRWKILYEVWGNFIRCSATSYKLPANIGPISCKLQSNFQECNIYFSEQTTSMKRSLHYPKLERLLGNLQTLSKFSNGNLHGKWLGKNE